MARKTTFGTRTKLTAFMADLRSVVRFNPNNNNSLSFSFVLDETLQLEETPITEYPIHSFSFALFPDAFQVFHNNLVSVEVGNNVFTYTMVFMLHPTSFSSRYFFKQSSAGASAFALKLRTQVFELSFDLFDLCRIIKPAIRSNGEVIYSEVNAQNNVLRSVVLLSGRNLFRESEQEETSAFFIHSQKAFGNFPFEITSITVRDIKVKGLSAIKQSQDKGIPFKVSTSWEIVSDGCSLDNWLGLSLLNHSTSLSHTGDSYLGREIKLLSDSVIDSIVEFEVLSDFIFPSIVNTELQRFCVSINSSNYLRSWIDTDFSSNYASHSSCKTQQVFKSFGGKWQFLPRLKSWVSLPHVL